MTLSFSPLIKVGSRQTPLCQIPNKRAWTSYLICADSRRTARSRLNRTSAGALCVGSPNPNPGSKNLHVQKKERVLHKIAHSDMRPELRESERGAARIAHSSATREHFLGRCGQARSVPAGPGDSLQTVHQRTIRPFGWFHRECTAAGPAKYQASLQGLCFEGYVVLVSVRVGLCLYSLFTG